jgi:hypothetical protein
VLIGGINRDTGSNFVDVYQNLIFDGKFGFKWNVYGDVSPVDVRVCNNTVYSVSNSGSYFKNPYADPAVYSGCRVFNNIFNKNGGAASSEWTGDLALSTQFDQFDAGAIDYNHFGDASNVFNSETFAALQAEISNLNGSTGNPLFTDAANDDYSLQAGSPCKNSGYDILDLTGNGVGSLINKGCFILSDQSDVIGLMPLAA